MRMSFLAAIAGVSLMGGCAHQGMDHAMDHGAMSHEDMMRHCQMMAEHHGEGGQPPADYNPAHHGGMSYAEMQRHCEAMRAAEQQTPPH